MKTLIKKDIELMGWNNLLIILVGVLFGFMNVLSDEADRTQAGALFAGFILINVLLSSLITEEGKTKDLILKSLPMDRRDIVLSRYITMFIYIIFIFGIMYITSQVYIFSEGSFAFGKPISFLDLLYNIMIVIIFISLVLPIQYLKRKISTILNIGLYLSVVLLPILISRTNGNINFINIFMYIGNFRFKINPIIYIPFGILMYFISFLISTKLYKSIDR